ncbi:ABC transporter permease [Deinococcota bacterium DY0809b]
MKIRSVIALASLMLTATLLAASLSAFQCAQLRLAWLADVAGRNVLIVRLGDSSGAIKPPGRDFLTFMNELPGFDRYALRATGGRRPNTFDYYTQYVSEGYFSLRGYRLADGRWLAQDGDEAVVGFGLRELLGRVVTVKGHEVRVVGVLASMSDRGWPDSEAEKTVFLPWRWGRGLPTFFVEFSSERAARDALPILQRWLRDHGLDAYEAEPLANLYGLELRQKLRNVLGGAMLWGVLAVLLVAGANLATFQLARALERIRVLGIRRAVGASRRDVLRESLASSTVWAAVGLALGLPLAYALAGWFEAFTGLDARPTPVAAVVTGLGLLFLVLVSAFLPARWAAGQPPAGAVRGFAASLPQKRLGLTVTSLALGMAALVVQLGVSRSADEHTRKLVGDLSSDTAVYSSFLFISSRSLTDPRGVTPLDHADYEALLASPLAGELRAHAYVEAYSGPLAGPAGEMYTYVRAYEGSYPELAGARLIAGRWPRSGGGEAAIGRELAERLFGRVDVLGMAAQALGQSWKLVGVYAGAGEALPGSAASDQLLLLRKDLGGTLPRARGEILVEKNPRAPEEIFEAIGRFLTSRHANPELAPVNAFTASDLAPEVRAVLLEITAVYRLLAVVILLLAGVGLAAQTAMIAQLETRTLGIRRALGASRGRVFFELLLPVLWAALLAGVLGAGAGVLVSYWVVRAHEVTWAFSWVAVVAVVLAAPLLAALAAALPAWRAVRRPPAEAMRVE